MLLHLKKMKSGALRRVDIVEGIVGTVGTLVSGEDEVGSIEIGRYRGRCLPSRELKY